MGDEPRSGLPQSTVTELVRERAEALAEVERLREAIIAHRKRWTSVNSGDLRQNAYPSDLELWDTLSD
jgi:hypothetical protein